MARSAATKKYPTPINPPDPFKILLLNLPSLKPSSKQVFESSIALASLNLESIVIYAGVLTIWK